MFQRLIVIMIALGLMAKPQPIIAQAEPIILQFWHPYADERGDVLEKLVEAFNAENSGRIVVDTIAFPSYTAQHEAILGALVNGGLPHLALIQNYDAALYQMSGALADLEPYVAQSSLKPEDFYPMSWAQDQYKGEQLGIPLTRRYTTLYVNMDALRELGYDNPPITREEMGAMACSFGDEGWSGYEGFDGVGYDLPTRGDFFLTLAQPFDYFIEGEFQFDAPPMRETIDLLKVQFADGSLAPSTPTIQESQNRFASGRTLFYIDSSEARQFVEEAIGMYYAEPFELGFVPLPGEQEPILNLAGYSLSMFRQDEVQQQAAWEFIEWMAQPEQIERWAAALNSIPARQDVPVADWVENAQWFMEPNFPGYDLVQDEVVFTMQAILSTGLEVGEALGELEALANQIYAVFSVE